MDIPKSYTITLLETPGRTNRCNSHFESVGMDSKFFGGVNAEVAGLKTVHPYEVDAPGSGFNIGQKYTGVWMSHFMLWSAFSLMGESHFHVMEVDAKLPDDWKGRFEQALRDAPEDFDLLYTGSCCCLGHPMDKVRGDVYQMKGGSGPQCLHSYIIAKKAIPVILETQRKIYAPIDISLIFHSFSKLKVYVVLPRIVDQFDTVIPP